MRHWKARRLLAALPDGMLPEDDEREVRAHLGDCAGCRRRLDQLELAESLLRHMPAALLPLERSPATHARLVSLARWSEEPELPAPGRWHAPVIAVVGFVATLFVAATMGSWSPVVQQSTIPTVIAMQPPESVYLPVTWQPFR